MDITELAKRKVYLEMRLSGISMSNVYGKTIDELTELEIDRAQTRKELNQILLQIQQYEESK